MRIHTTSHSMIADLTSPVAAYLRLRSRYPRSLLLEGSDYHNHDDARSFICCDPIAEFKVENGILYRSMLGSDLPPQPVEPGAGFAKEVSSFLASFSVDTTPLPKGVVNGIFGYSAFDSIELMEQISLKTARNPETSIPQAHFIAYRFILAFDHFKNEAHLVENRPEGEETSSLRQAFMDTAFNGPLSVGTFKTVEPERSALTDEEFKELIVTCKKHIARGDVFQIVPSRRFTRRFVGDDFQVYRCLRSINRSPYLFYGDFGEFRLFGSSPEAQTIVRDGVAELYPIAGTVPRHGDDKEDRARVERLLEDPKENAEHAMLVDLARNDLSRRCKGVHVSTFREVQTFSHVIHLVSRVKGSMTARDLAPQILADTFPLGTLSGAPKYRAIELLDEHERIRRDHYGGCIGFFGFNGDAVFAIMIRSFLSKNDTLTYQVGMGVVLDSVPDVEVQEANAKVRALRLAIEKAQELRGEV